MNNLSLVNISNKKRLIHLFCRDEKGKLQIEKVNSFFPYFYAPDSEGNYQSYTGTPLRKIIVSEPKAVVKNRSDKAYEADILFIKRYLIDKVDKIDKCPIKYNFIDIETLSDELPNVQEAKYPVSCISVYNSLYKSIQSFYLGDYENDYQLLDNFIKYMITEKFDIWFSWNVKFDYDYIYNRIEHLKTSKKDSSFAQKISPIGQTRYGNGETYYPAGISIVDYLTWFKSFTKNKDRSYALDAVAQEHLGQGKVYKPDFSKLNPEIKKRNIEDVEIMIKLEEKFKLIPHYDEIRRFSMVEWEDLGKWNSRIIDMLALKTAKKLKVVLPMKSQEEDAHEFEGGFREAYKTGVYFNKGKYDISGAYMYTIINLCIDSANIREEANKNTIKIGVTDRVSRKLLTTYNVKQNNQTILPLIAKQLVEEKNILKKKRSLLDINTEEYKNIDKKYEALKTIVLSAWGVMGNKYFRLYDHRVASMITSTVRSLIWYVEEKLKELNYEILYVDTDGFVIDDNGENIEKLLNDIVQKWAKEKFNKSVDIVFEYEGNFEKLFIATKCRYKGYLRTKSGLKEEVKGLEIKRKDSTAFMQKFQDLLLDKIMNKESKKDILNWIKLQISSIKNVSMEDIAFPCKLSRKPEDYSSVPIFLRALNNTPQLKKKIGDPYFYVYINPNGEPEISTEIYINNELIKTLNYNMSKKDAIQYISVKALDKSYITGTENDEKKIKVLHKKSKLADVIAFDEDNKSHIKKDDIDWTRIIERNITMKLVTIFEAMLWDLGELNLIEGKPSIPAGQVSKKTRLVSNQESKVQVLSPAPAEKMLQDAHLVSNEKDRVQVPDSAPNVLSVKKTDFNKENYVVKEVLKEKVYEWLLYKHYAHRVPSISYAFGLYDNKNKLNGIITFGQCPASKINNIFKSYKVLELNRLVVNDNLPKNALSYFVSQSLNNLPIPLFIVSFADVNNNHRGYIYQATNWYYTGMNEPAPYYIIEGKKYHPKSVYNKYKTHSVKKLNLMGIKFEKLKEKYGKHRYYYIIANKKDKKLMKNMLLNKYKLLPYPKIEKNSQVPKLTLDTVNEEFDKIQKEKAKTEILNFNLEELKMKRMDFKETKKYIVDHHYSHTIASSMRLSLGFFYKDKLVTNVVYGYPVGRRVIQWLGVKNEECAELVRLFSQDGLPKNVESYCIAQSFKYIKENMVELKYLISYADPNHGHVGYIYQATNWRYIGVQRRLLPERRIFIDGIETHTRTLNAKHGSTSKKQLEEIYGDRLEIKSALKKHVYLMCLGNRKEKKMWYKKFDEKDYPKITQENKEV